MSAAQGLLCCARKKRRLIRKAIELYRIRGTVKGIKLFIALPIDKLDRMSLKRRADEIGRSIEYEER